MIESLPKINIVQAYQNLIKDNIENNSEEWIEDEANIENGLPEGDIAEDNIALSATVSVSAANGKAADSVSLNSSA